LPISGIEVTDISTDTPGALRSLAQRRVDLVLVTPADAVQKIEGNQHAELTFYHREIDPFEVTYVRILADRITEETNRQLMLSAIETSKEEARKYQSELQRINDIQDQAMGGDGQEDANTAESSTAFGVRELMFVLLQATSGGENGLQAEGLDNQQADTPTQDNPSGAEDTELQRIETQLTRFVETDSQVIAEPFQAQSRSLSEVDVKPVHFYVPAVLALLLQHLAISLAGLSIVSDRFAGTMELMRAAPVNAFEVLLGKYVSFTVFLGFLTAVLTVLIHWGIGVPIIGSWPLYALVACLVILVSLGFGFLISSFARSDSQAIQFAMIILLASIFFSGFFLQLYRLRWPAQTISWLMPSTYGLRMLQDIMLRGDQPQPWLFWVLGGLAFAFFILNWLRLRRLMVQS
jgi:ABC-2 type transport system permease protein